MTGGNTITLKINENFKRLIPPLSPEELQQLEQNLIRDGCREPLCVWNNTIIDGHNRYEICTRLQIPFTIRRIFFKCREEATVWICTNQLGRRNITDEMRKYLIGKRFELEKVIGAHNAAGTNQYTKKKDRPKILAEPTFDKTARRTSDRIGEEYHISHATIDKYGIYANALDNLLIVVPEFVQRILSGQVKISHINIIELSRLSPQDILYVSKQISKDPTRFIGYSVIRKFLPKRQDSPRPLTPIIPAGSVKNMPTYDPDAEISSLALTIPSWISSINRTHTVSNFNEISSNARCKLEKGLLELKLTIENMLSVIKEEK